MEIVEEEQKVIRRYLLGKLDEKQCQKLEERILTSPAFKTQVMIAEDELAEDYKSGMLSPGDQETFRHRILMIREQRQRFEVISALSTYAVRQPPVPVSVPIAAVAHDSGTQRPGSIKLLALLFGRPVLALLATAIILVAGFAFWLATGSFGPRPNADELLRRQEVEREIRRLNPQGIEPPPTELMAPASHISYVTLIPNLVRGAGELAKVDIPDNVTVVRFHLKPPLAGFDSYRVTIHTNKGIEFLRHEGLTPQALGGFKYLIFNMPSSALPPGDYQLRLSGRRDTTQFEEVADYYFRVARHNSQ